MKDNDAVKRILAASLSAALAVMYVPFPVMADDKPAISSSDTDLSENYENLISEPEIPDVDDEQQENDFEEEEQEEESKCKFTLGQSENGNIYISEIDENGIVSENEDVVSEYSTDAGKKLKITVREKNQNMKFSLLTVNGETVRTYYDGKEYIYKYTVPDNVGRVEVKADFVPAAYESEVFYDYATGEVNGSGKNDGSIIIDNDKVIVAPAAGYYINGIFVNGQKVSPDSEKDQKLNDCTVSGYDNGDNHSGILTLSEVRVDALINIRAEFKKINQMSVNDITVSSDSILGSKNNIYFARRTDKDIIIKANYPNSKIGFKSGVKKEEQEYHGYIDTVYIYYRDSEYYKEDSEHILDLSDNNIKVFFIKKSIMSLIPEPLADGCTAYGTDTFNVKVNLAKDERFESSGCQEVAEKLKFSEITYWFDENQNEAVTLKQNGIEPVSQSENISEYYNITVNSSEHNKAGTVIHVKATDSLGYTYEDSAVLNVNNTLPEVSVSVNEKPVKKNNQFIYKVPVTATVTVTDKEYTFNKDENFIINSVNIIKDGQYLSYDQKKSIINDMQIYDNMAVFDICFKDDAVYQWDVSYKNLAGNCNLPYSDKEFSRYNFSVCKTNITPFAEDFRIGFVYDNKEYNWGEITNSHIIKFLNYFQKEVTVIVKVPDEVSPEDITEISYCKTSNTGFLTAEDEFIVSDTGVTVSPNEKVVVYARIIDKADNVIYLGTDGLVFDNREPQLVSIDFADDDDSLPENLIFNKDVRFNVSVQEETENIMCSGLRDVYYQVYDENNKLIENSTVYLIKDNPDSEMSGYNGEIVISGKDYNRDNLSVKVFAVDNAGNQNTVSSAKFSINVDPMTAVFTIDGSSDINGKSFNSDTLELQIECPRGFEADKATQAVNKAFGYENVSEGDVIPYTIGEWKEDENGRHIVSVRLTDGTYNITDFTYTNNAGNSAYADSITFNVDTEAPVGIINVSVRKQNEDGTYTESSNNEYSDLKTGNASFENYVSKDYRMFIEVNTEENAKIEYYVAEGDETFLDEDTLTELSTKNENKQWKLYTETVEPVEAEGRYIVYIRITDDAGNYTYLCSDGFVIDRTAPEISLKADGEEKTVYNNSINLKINVSDSGISSDIKSAVYYLVTDGVQKEEIPLDAGENNITISADQNNSSNVEVRVEAVDNAGNSTEIHKAFDIDVAAPVVELSYSDNSDQKYFRDSRMAKISVKERNNHFNGVELVRNGEKINIPASEFTAETNENTNPDECVHVTYVSFDEEKDYNLTISCSDTAGNTSNKVNSSFTIDRTPPTGTITVYSFEGREDIIGELLQKINFGFWSNSGFYVTAHCDDSGSPIEEFKYYITDNAYALTKDELQTKQWTSFIGGNPDNRKSFTSDVLTINANTQAVIYVKMTDKAGNTSYIGTNGLIADDSVPFQEINAPEVNVTPQQTASGIYNGNVDVGISVRETGNVYSGISMITYRVINNGVETQSDTLYYFYNEAPEQRELIKEWDGQITVDSQLNNSNNVVIEVTAVDNAGNTSTSSSKINIDTTAPVIDMTFSDNKSNSSSDNYYSSRTANFVITERNFDSNDVVLNVTKDNVTTSVSLDWQSVGGSGDAAQYAASLPFTTDGTYSFSISFTDMAGNKSNQISSEPFTIDSSAPKISVRFDNNEVRESRYFKKGRTAEIVISDNNVNIDAVDIRITGSLDGKSIDVPAKPVWTNDGDTYTGKIKFVADGDYTFNIGIVDLSGNRNSAVDYGDSVSPDSFTIDNVNPKLEVTVNDSSKNGAYSGDVIPVIRYSDVNYDEDNVSVSMSGVNVEVSDVNIKDDTIVFTLKSSSGKTLEWKGRITEQYTENNHLSGKNIEMENFPKGEEYKDFDDIYTLTVSIMDKAGRLDADNIVFSVNRFGSTYDINAVRDILGKYIQSAEDVEIVEINADKLSDIKITVFKNGEAVVLNSGTDYEMITDGGNGNWYEYRYIIDRKNFEDDGVYRINVHSKDSANNIAENTLDTKNSEISFAVDSTPPSIVVANLESGKTYAEENKSVMFNINDNLKVDSIKVYLDDDKKAYKSWNSMEVEKFIIDNEEFKFDIGSDSNGSHNVKIVCTDAAGNSTETVISDFYVTTDMMIRYVNNKSVFFGTIAGAVAVAGGSAFWIFRRKKRF